MIEIFFLRSGCGQAQALTLFLVGDTLCFEAGGYGLRREARARRFWVMGRAFIVNLNGFVSGFKGLEMLASHSYYDYNLEPCMEGCCSNAWVGLNAVGGDVERLG